MSGGNLILTTTTPGDFDVTTLSGQTLRIATNGPVTAGGSGGLQPQPASLSGVLIVDPQNATGVATSTGSRTATVTAFDGTTRTGPVYRFWRDLVAAWGTWSPYFAPAFQPDIVFASSHTDDTDPIVFQPIVGNTVFIEGALIPGTPATLSVLSVKDRAAGANSALVVTGPTAVGQFVLDTTTSPVSYAWAYKALHSGETMMTQPLASATPYNAVVNPAEVDTWTESDDLTLFSLIKVFVAYLKPINATQTVFTGLSLWALDLFDPSGTPGNTGTSIDVTAGECSLYECSIETFLATNGSSPTGLSMALVNCRTAGGVDFISSGFIIGGSVSEADSANGGVEIGGDYAGGIFLDADVILSGPPSTPGVDVVILPSGVVLGFVCLDNGSYLSLGAADVSVSANIFGYGGQCIYSSTVAGNERIQLFGFSRLVYAASATATFTLPTAVSGGIYVNGRQAASKHSNASPDVLTSNVATTVANIDAATQGTMFQLGGASIAPSTLP